MRPLTEEETKILFEKLAKYIGKNVLYLIDREDEPYCFRLHRNRCYYISEKRMRLAITIPKKRLISLGTCFGKFTKTNKFRIHITALDYLAQYANYKIWVQQKGEMPYLYGNHVIRAHVGKMSEGIPEHQGVVICSMNDTPLGFAVTAKSTSDSKKLQPTDIVAFHQTDIGEYLRNEDDLI
ncbi:hypothetical protein T552_01182 [Pneumocystis carinii B80]|uniref:60S ribosome subunit biogenesis protein NIP7 n=1 Tax=Pneumocystis carinii (strain B80) TaxID=1408658 RepID=A0A0W4ZLI2_PNEC8|nr:hypothetical protein T552_01182 [Pneumocystis carinii B80]KTW29226.1 hypothetical protein T552_01182 [Pneumocystis carinii B80]